MTPRLTLTPRGTVILHPRRWGRDEPRPWWHVWVAGCAVAMVINGGMMWLQIWS